MSEGKKSPAGQPAHTMNVTPAILAQVQQLKEEYGELAHMDGPHTKAFLAECSRLLPKLVAHRILLERDLAAHPHQPAIEDALAEVVSEIQMLNETRIGLAGQALEERAEIPHNKLH
ncbi:MAG: hypothetical protein AAB421_02965 [Patescibacteria group bacterium]|mgnify:CR=1 FL=1